MEADDDLYLKYFPIQVPLPWRMRGLLLFFMMCALTYWLRNLCELANVASTCV
jgi:hypothetical protein